MVLVIYGSSSSMPELVGYAGLAADSDDPAVIALQMYRPLSESHLGAELSRRAPERASELTWNRTAVRTLEVYDAAISPRSSE